MLLAVASCGSTSSSGAAPSSPTTAGTTTPTTGVPPTRSVAATTTTAVATTRPPATAAPAPTTAQAQAPSAAFCDAAHAYWKVLFIDFSADPAHLKALTDEAIAKTDLAIQLAPADIKSRIQDHQNVNLAIQKMFESVAYDTSKLTYSSVMAVDNAGPAVDNNKAIIDYLRLKCGITDL
jgi:hypothetical protein